MKKKASTRAKRLSNTPLSMSSSAQQPLRALTGDTEEAGAVSSVVTHGSSGNHSRSHQQHDVTTSSASSRRSTSPVAADRKNDANASTDDSVREELKTLERDMTAGLQQQLLSQHQSIIDVQNFCLNNDIDDERLPGVLEEAATAMEEKVRDSLAQWVLHPVTFKDSTDSVTNRSS